MKTLFKNTLLTINQSNSDTFCGGKLNTMKQAVNSRRVSSKLIATSSFSLPRLSRYQVVPKVCGLFIKCRNMVLFGHWPTYSGRWEREWESFKGKEYKRHDNRMIGALKLRFEICLFRAAMSNSNCTHTCGEWVRTHF